MYCSIRGSQAWNSNDTRVAKRMALLVFTDFACWAPITFFSLTAAFKWELISLNDAKVFTIFVLPLNSCANPFLYAIFTKQFKKDCSILCKKLEESALSRSLSRFSNKNISMSWGTSRRPSALNSFFTDQRFSRSYSISGASASHHDHSLSAGTNSEARVLLHSNCHFTKLNNERAMDDIPVFMPNYMMPPTNAVCNGHVYGCKENSKISPNNKNICSCHKGPSGLRVPGRGAPVGAGSGMLSLLRLKKDVDKMGDGMDSDQEDSTNSWALPRETQDYMRLYPLLPLNHSPTMRRTSRGRAKARSYSPASMDESPTRSPRTKPVKHVRIKSAPTTPSNMPNKRMLNLNCCNGSPKSTEKSPGAEYQLMRRNEDSSSFANNSSSFTNDSSVFENNIRKNKDTDMDYLNNHMDNNNHEYMNITQEIINELQRMRNESAASDGNSTDLQNERVSGNGKDGGFEVLVETEDVEKDLVKSGEGGEDDIVRVEPEGSESKEKLNVVKLDPLSALPRSKKCMCNNPNCTDKFGERTPEARDLTPSPDPLTMNRDAWIGSTERNLISPDDGYMTGLGSHMTTGGGASPCPVSYPMSRQADRRKHFTKKKFYSVDNNEVLEIPNDDAYGRDASSSMPVLTITDNSARKSKNGSAQYRNGFAPDLNIDPHGAKKNPETIIAILNSCKIPLNSLQHKINPKMINYSDSKLSSFPRNINRDDNELNMGGSLEFLSLNTDGDPESERNDQVLSPSHSSVTSMGSHGSVNSSIREQGLFRSLHLGGRVSPTAPEFHRTEVRLTDSIPKVLLKQPSHEEEEEEIHSQESKI